MAAYLDGIAAKPASCVNVPPNRHVWEEACNHAALQAAGLSAFGSLGISFCPRDGINLMRRKI